uniref:Calponin-homology (CH) domain-containing protein n=1 Tax=Chlamydomonas euryale TaxID=1486919 RepID=A0A7R9VBL5_9CHLO|mmetsp:Transcript_27203/g.80702  ORF Transcript_27203/g.80702 Transcript_27203/m.80702 type:complete len:231 (+) Transcript_27203:115-807(+)
MDVSEAELQTLYTWVDEIPLSRPKRNISRDFSDGVLMAEVVHHFFPKIVELHNYSSANGTQQKMYNWNTLSQKVFKRMGFTLSKEDMDAMCNCQPGAVERVLKLMKVKIAKCCDEGLAGTIVDTPKHVASPTPQQYTSASPPPQPMVAPRHTKQHAPSSGPGHAAPQMSIQSRMPAAHGEEVHDLRETVSELKETNEILETKVRKLEQLVRLKDAKIQTLMAKLQAGGLA